MKRTLRIKLDTIEKIRSFVSLVSLYPNDFDLISGRYTIDAKSIMGIFSLDLSQPADLIIHGEIDEDLLKQINEYAA